MSTKNIGKEEISCRNEGVAIDFKNRRRFYRGVDWVYYHGLHLL